MLFNPRLAKRNSLKKSDVCREFSRVATLLISWYKGLSKKLEFVKWLPINPNLRYLNSKINRNLWTNIVNLSSLTPDAHVRSQYIAGTLEGLFERQFGAPRRARPQYPACSAPGEHELWRSRPIIELGKLSPRLTHSPLLRRVDVSCGGLKTPVFTIILSETVDFSYTNEGYLRWDM